MIPGFLAKAGKDAIRSMIPDLLRKFDFLNLDNCFNPKIEVPNGLWGQNKNLSVVVLSPPVVNETGFYCHIMLDEIEQSPFATPEDLTMRIEAEEQDLSEFGNSWGFDELYPIRFRSGNRNLKSDVSISGTFSGKKEISEIFLKNYIS